MRLARQGSISQYRQKAIWLAGTADLRLDKGEPGRWLRDLSDRGYLELDWQQGRWTSSPLVVTKLPNSDGLAIIAGFVRPGSLEALNDVDVDIHVVNCTPSRDRTLARPAVMFLQYASSTNLEDAASAIDATYVPCSALQLAPRLSTVALGRESAPPNMQNDTIAYYDVVRLRWSPPPPGLAKPGLYRYEGNGHQNFLWYEGDSWRHCDMSAGIWTALARSGTNAIRWRPYLGHDPETGQGTLFTDLGAPLPPLHRRCLVLCSGKSPVISLSAGTARYDNVPREIADVMWRTLGQRSRIVTPGQSPTLT